MHDTAVCLNVAWSRAKAFGQSSRLTAQCLRERRRNSHSNLRRGRIRESKSYLVNNLFAVFHAKLPSLILQAARRNLPVASLTRRVKSSLTSSTINR